MSATENGGNRLQKRTLTSAITAVLSMLLTLVLMMILSALIANGKLSPSYERELVMLCVFLANLIITATIIRKNGEGILITSVMNGLFYTIILLIMAISAGSKRLLNAGLIKISISAFAGSILHIALKMASTAKKANKRRRR